MEKNAGEKRELICVTHRHALLSKYRLEACKGIVLWIVRDHFSYLDTGANEKVNKDALKLGLTGLEVIATDKHLVQLGQFHNARHKTILWRAVQESTLEGKKDQEHENISKKA